ncbi:MAG: helix-turn-helix domain-containing protein [Kiritimatiellae bacterium]|nr:helix-turn-helix domain-containing protein [Kiritimatiellia bacterium]
MQTLGQKLRAAREQRQQTVSQVAAATRIKTQLIEDIENDDFTRIVAPVYGKGFIKLYAEHLELDAGPLVEEYLGRIGEQERMALPSERAKARAGQAARRSAWRVVRAWLAEGRLSRIRLPHIDYAERVLLRKPWHLLGAALGAVLLAVFVSSVARSCAERTPSEQPAGKIEAPPRLVDAPPPPYLD